MDSRKEPLFRLIVGPIKRRLGDRLMLCSTGVRYPTLLFSNVADRIAEYRHNEFHLWNFRDGERFDSDGCVRCASSGEYSHVSHVMTQLVSNGSRAWLLRESICWKSVRPYIAGLLISLVLFACFKFVPSKAVVFIILGVAPILGMFLPDRWVLDIREPKVAFSCGMSIIAVKLLAGASGPVLDMFSVKSSYTRHEMVGTKAMTQSHGHIAKLIYYGVFIGHLAGGESLVGLLWLTLLIPFAAISGTRAGKMVLDRMRENRFRRYARGVVFLLSIVFLFRGIAYAFSV